MHDGEDSGPSFPFFALCRRAPVTVVLIAASIAVALLSGMGQDLEALSWLTFADLHGSDASVPGGFADILGGQAWRLITPILIHFGPMHLLFNMLWLWDLGTLIETRWSSRLLAVLVLVLAVTANVAQFCINWDLRHGLEYANVLSGGMSGVVYGLLGYLWIRGHRDPAAGIRIRRATVVWMLAWLVLCCTGYIGRIGNSAHATGLVVGAALGWAAARRTRGLGDDAR